MMNTLIKNNKNVIQRAVQARFSSNVPSNRKDVPKYNELEFEPFKFNNERANLMYGYTFEELYGSRYGLKHSPMIRREQSKDNVMMVLVLLAVSAFCLAGRDQEYEMDRCFNNYLYADMNTVRSLPENKN